MNQLIELSWNAPPECPGRDDVLELVQINPESSGGLKAEARVVRSRSGFLLVLRTEQSEQQGVRELTSNDCKELAEVTAALLSLALADAKSKSEAPVDESLPSAERLRPDEAKPISSHRLWLDLGVQVSNEVLPETSLGPMARLALSSEPLRWELGFSVLAPVRVVGVGRGEARFGQWAGEVGACSLFGQTFRWGGCLHAQIGAIRGRSEGITETKREVVAWISPVVSLHLGIERGLLAFSLRPHLSAPLVRPQFEVSPFGIVFQPESLVVGGQAFASWRF